MARAETCSAVRNADPLRQVPPGPSGSFGQGVDGRDVSGVDGL
jgi:hypothetical protein